MFFIKDPYNDPLDIYNPSISRWAFFTLRTIDHVEDVKFIFV